MPNSTAPTRLVSCTTSSGTVHFNQAVLEATDAPDTIVLVAVHESDGLYIWEAPFGEVFERSTPQHAGYSRTIADFHVTDPPKFLGVGELIPRASIDESHWSAFLVARTNTLNRLLRKYLDI
jgi:hypothetical protein